MKAQEYILLIFAVLSFWTAPISADIYKAYDPFDWQSERSADFSESLPNESIDTDRSCLEYSDENTFDNVYDYTVQKPNGQDICLNEYAGQVLIIVNYASACGFTYDNVCALSELSKKYKNQGLTILIFPSNDFLENIGGNTAAELLAKNHPEFEVFSEICVNGKAQHPVYRFLTNKLPGTFNSKSIKWNFTKFVVDREGCPVQRFSAIDSFKDIEKLVKELLETPPCKCDDY
ncbi:uncharacterized protein LOC132929537 [Rhopalosiphum padi]|uniref:uncharacterized protein LOC132929537 n=1 Tax=Rhopalosiphum padi TaxID=40932 RepID=UPI00298E0093|nr:uncharacterized protein LOC132929537 [Rhopalosiphum padi]